MLSRDRVMELLISLEPPLSQTSSEQGTGCVSPKSWRGTSLESSVCVCASEWKHNDRQKWAKGRGKWTPSKEEILLSLSHKHTRAQRRTHTHTHTGRGVGAQLGLVW